MLDFSNGQNVSKKYIKQRWYPYSSNINKITINKQNNTMMVRFQRTHDCYIYMNVKKDVWQRLTNISYIRNRYDNSIGKAFLQEILKEHNYTDYKRL